jgi:hypothetical protein
LKIAGGVAVAVVVVVVGSRAPATTPASISGS